MPYTNYYKCSIPGCDEAQRGRGFCYKHYRRFMEHGDPLVTKYASAETKLKFMHDVVLSCETLECLIWPFSRRDGRGYINEEPASRFVCKSAHGLPPTEMHDAAHNCGNELCVNPHHLRWATRKENMADRDRHGTDQRGEKAYNAVLSTDDVKRIRSLARSLNNREIADLYDVTPQTISKIILRQRWSHV